MILRYRLSPSYGPTFLASLRHNPGGCSCNEPQCLYYKTVIRLYLARAHIKAHVCSAALIMFPVGVLERERERGREGERERGREGGRERGGGGREGGREGGGGRESASLSHTYSRPPPPLLT